MTKVGFLPLYIALYDTALPQMRVKINAFNEKIQSLIKGYGIELVASDVCCVKEQFESAIKLFERNNVDSIISLHLAYSPSLESYEALCKTKLPLIIMDTTPDYDFNYEIDSNAYLYNHGIHGVQDLTNLLRRNGKDYTIFAGHYENSTVIKDVCDTAKAISSAKRLKNGIRVGMIGKKFEGMGDFIVSEKELESIGITKVYCDENELLSLSKEVKEEDLKKEYESDKSICKMDKISFDFYKSTERVAFAVRNWIKNNKIDGFSINFQSAGEMKGLDTMPFSEAGKEMAKGIGYAGEGDVLSAGILGAFMPQFNESSFCEMFCPDWKGNTVFLSHMGEFNLSLLENKHMIEKDFPYADSPNPTCIMGHMKGGKCCLLNISPDGKGGFSMIFCDGEMVKLPYDIKSYNDVMSGWFKPSLPLSDFLKKFSEAGGTHHSLLIYGVKAESLVAFAKEMNMEYKVI